MQGSSAPFCASRCDGTRGFVDRQNVLLEQCMGLNIHATTIALATGGGLLRVASGSSKGMLAVDTGTLTVATTDATGQQPSAVIAPASAAEPPSAVLDAPFDIPREVIVVAMREVENSERTQNTVRTAGQRLVRDLQPSRIVPARSTPDRNSPRRDRTPIPYRRWKCRSRQRRSRAGAG
jgi:hypothetical protein